MVDSCRVNRQSHAVWEEGSTALHRHRFGARVGPRLSPECSWPALQPQQLQLLKNPNRED